MACACSATKASGDPAGMSIRGLGGARRRTKGKKSSTKATKRRGKRRAPSRNAGAFCVITAAGKTFSCGFKSKASAQKMTRGKSGWKVKPNARKKKSR